MDVISCTFKGRFGFFKKPDINENLFLTYNIIPRPSLLGLLGAIIGLEGYDESGKVPRFLTELNNLKIALKPVDQENRPSFQGSFTKTVIDYNNSTGLASKEPGGNLIVKEQTLLQPAYRCHILLDGDNRHQEKLKQHLLDRDSVYIPYFGKNEHRVWWDDVVVSEVDENQRPEEEFQVDSLFRTKDDIRMQDHILSVRELLRKGYKDTPYSYFEKIPISIDTSIKRYNLKGFMFTNSIFKPDFELPSLFKIKNSVDDGWVQFV